MRIKLNEALQRLQAAISHKPKERRAIDFEFVIDDHTTYYLLSDFKSPKAKTLFKLYQQLKKTSSNRKTKLNSLRQQYAQANQQGKAKMAPAVPGPRKAEYCKCPKNSMLSK